MKRRWMLILAAVLALSLVAVACGDDDDDDGDSEQAATTEGPVQIEATAGEYFFELSEDIPEDGGQVTVTMTNEGEEPHALVFARINEGFTLDEAFEAQGEKGTAETLGELEAGPGQAAKGEITADLTPGQYAMVCPVETKGVSHFEEGQKLEFDVE